ncbi:hypothetical protein U9M48_038399 [Paspalum notatum var. saurae]|uniref:Aminotransferase-like plant mobile domain-containing protein n=1 Tax=Paspalum notatum var. saurae TaxID=547442 RepID=A0AAQ3UHD1_PASNO
MAPQPLTPSIVALCGALLRRHMQWRRKAAAPWRMALQRPGPYGPQAGPDRPVSLLPIRSASCAPTGRRLHRRPPAPPPPTLPSPPPPPPAAAAAAPPLHRRPSPRFSVLPTEEVLMADPQYLLLDPAVELKHRASHIAAGELSPLRGRTHTHHLSWNERYAPYIQKAGMLDLARVVTSGLPPLDLALLTALVDRWRSETHTLHLPCGEMTITLEDTAMILGLPVDGSPVIHSLDPVAWPAPPQRVSGDRSTRTSGVTTGWLRQHFGVCPPDAGPVQVEWHARGWLWYLLACFLLPDSSRNTVDSALLPILDRPWADIATFSWASRTLAHMYRQLCDGCQRKENSSSIGGCLCLLQWAFEDSRPTVLWFWRDVEVVTGRIDGRYKRYSNELNCFTHRQWTPYYREEIEEARAVVPLIFFVVVEYHIPTRVLRQFGRRQVVPPHTVPTDLSLHIKRRQGRYSETDWHITHVAHTGRWDARQRVPVEAAEAHDKAYFVEYLRWLQAHARVRLRPTVDHRPISEVDSDEIDEYDTRTRGVVQPERASIQDYVTVSRHCRRLSRKIGCYSAAALPPQPRGVPGSPSSSRGRSSRRSRSSEDEDDDEEEGEDDDDGDGDRGLDVLFGSQLHDAPPFTQTQHDAEAVRRVDIRLLGGVGVLVTLRTWTAATASTLALLDKVVHVAVRHLEGRRIVNLG